MNTRNAVPTETMTEEFSIHEMNAAINKLKNKKAPGNYQISNEMIKHLSKYSKQILLQISNQSWNSGQYPTTGKKPQ